MERSLRCTAERPKEISKGVHREGDPKTHQCECSNADASKESPKNEGSVVRSCGLDNGANAEDDDDDTECPLAADFISQPRHEETAEECSTKDKRRRDNATDSARTVRNVFDQSSEVLGDVVWCHSHILMMLDVARRLFASLDRLLHCVFRRPMERKQVRITDTHAESELKSRCQERNRGERMQNRYTTASASMLNSSRRLTLTGAGAFAVRRAIIWGLEKIASFCISRGVGSPHWRLRGALPRIVAKERLLDQPPSTNQLRRLIMCPRAVATSTDTERLVNEQIRKPTTTTSCSGDALDNLLD